MLPCCCIISRHAIALVAAAFSGTFIFPLDILAAQEQWDDATVFIFADYALDRRASILRRKGAVSPVEPRFSIC